MQSFLTRHGSQIKGVLSGFDRVRFRGTLLWLANLSGVGTFLNDAGVLLKDFQNWALGLTDRIRDEAQALAKAAQRPLHYVNDSQLRKEDLARQIAQRDSIESGLVCVLTAVEPCMTFSVWRNREQKRLELRPRSAKCLHHYYYLMHPRLGPMHLRLQTWLPFNVHVCINGREWLARDLRRARIGFEQRDNCFVEVADAARAQQLFDAQLKVRWEALLDGLLADVHPTHASLFGDRLLDYYWSAEQTEWATDVMFHSPSALAAHYPRWLHQAMTTFRSGDVMRFLGRRPDIYRFKTAAVETSFKTRPEGVRVKHQINGNSVKMYDKQPTVLRIETTIHNPRDLKVFRPADSNPDGPKKWQKMRKGVADLHRRAQISQKSNDRYLEALATVDCDTRFDSIVRTLCQPTTWHGRRVRALRPFEAEDCALLAAIARGEFLLNGFRNRDLRPLLFGTKVAAASEAKRQAAKISRMIRMLRAHGIAQKVPKTHRYQLTETGRNAITALHAAQNATVQQLTKLAA